MNAMNGNMPPGAPSADTPHNFGLPPGYADALRSETTIALDWPTALKLALGWRLQVNITVYTESAQGRLLQGPSEVYPVRLWRWPWQKPIAFVQADEQPQP